MIWEKGSFEEADFRMNLFCNRLYIAMKDEIGTYSGLRMRPEVSLAFEKLCIALRNLDEVTAKFMQEAEQKGD